MKVEKDYTVKYITVLSGDLVKENGVSYNLCRCKCGKELLIRNHTLRTKRIRDCGCGTYKLEECIGKNFGELTVLNAYRERLYGRVNIMCTCKCSCGNVSDFLYTRLLNGYNDNCGCLSKFNFDKYKGNKYNGIEVLELIDESKKTVKCKCHCGEIFTCNLHDLTAKKRYIVGCAKCLRQEENTHSKYSWNKKLESRRLEGIYYGMIDRCYNKNNKAYKHYGERGIIVCKEWKENKKSFFDWSLKNGYKDFLQIDRINYNGNYSPENCRWVDVNTQANNRRNNRIIEYNGNKYTLSQIAKLFDINYATLCSRIRKGEDILSAVSRKVKKRG